MPNLDRSSDPQREKRPEEKAIIGAIGKYFNAAPSHEKSKSADMETSIITALRRYFGAK
jgi:hypothetical protein